MGAIARRSARTQQNLEVIETALDRTQSALRAAEAADLAMGKAARGTRKLLKWLLVLGVIGAVALVVKKVLEDSDTPSDPVNGSRT